MTKNLKLFYSWQSDILDSKIIISDEIEAAIRKIKEKYGYSIELDEITKRIPGSPHIENTIYQKINETDIFIADITPVTSFNNKLYPNSNVVYELGYAVKSIGYEKIILVAKARNWKTTELPFDFNHRKIIIFSSDKDCKLYEDIEECVKFCLDDIKIKKISFPICNWGKKLTNIFDYRKQTIKANNKLLKATEESTEMFSRRIANAFPGDRGLVVHTELNEIESSLKALLQYPLDFKAGYPSATTDPIWWFRGGSAEHIKSFKQLRGRQFLMNYEEINIKRIAVYRDSGRYYAQYVYVETMVKKHPAYNNKESENIKKIVRDLGYYDEEYALFKPFKLFPAKKITLQEYDDGACRLFGKLINIKGRAERRMKYLTPYNFIICAKFAPYNSHEYDRTSGEYLNKILKNEITIEDFNNYMKLFPRRDIY